MIIIFDNHWKVSLQTDFKLGIKYPNLLLNYKSKLSIESLASKQFIIGIEIPEFSAFFNPDFGIDLIEIVRYQKYKFISFEAM